MTERIVATVVSYRPAHSEPGLLESLYDGVVEGGFSDNKSPVKIVSQIGVGFIPVVGQIADGRDTVAALHKVATGKPDAWSSLGLALLGWIPLGGDTLKAIFRRRQ
jgi:hypothetical protein